MSTMLTPARPSASAISATTPGRLGTDGAQLVHGPPASPAPSSASRSARARSFHALDRRRVAGGERLADLARRAASSSMPAISASRLDM